MNLRVLLIQSIALLYWESVAPDSGYDSRALISGIINDLPDINGIAGTDEDRENLQTLRTICLSFAEGNQTIDKSFLENKLKLNIKKDPELRQDVIDSLQLPDDGDEAVLKRIQSLHTELNNWLNQKAMKDEIRKIASKTIYTTSPTFNVSDMAREIIGTMERFVGSTSNQNDPALHSYFDVNDIEHLTEQFEKVQEDGSPDMVLKTGWQGLNRMFGEIGGLRRGNMYVIGAMPSMGKSLVTSCITLHAAMFNTPYLLDKTKKPCIVHISTENDTNLNLRIWFRYLWECEYNERCNLEDHDPHSMATWFNERVTRNGYHFKAYHIDPNLVHYTDIISRLMRLEAEGYELHLVSIDYLMMIKMDDKLGEGTQAFWIQQLFKILRQYTNPRQIALITPHQVSTEAALLKRQGATDFVKQVAGKRYWMYCRGLDTEVDCEIILNIEHDHEKRAYMAFGRGKDRSTQGTPEKDKFFFIPFSQYGGLKPDINDKDTTKYTLREGIQIDDDWGTGNNNESKEF